MRITQLGEVLYGSEVNKESEFIRFIAVSTRSRVKAVDDPAMSSENEGFPPRGRKRMSVDREIISNTAILNSPRRVGSRRLSTDAPESTPPVRVLRGRRVSVDRDSAAGVAKVAEEDNGELLIDMSQPEDEHQENNTIISSTQNARTASKPKRLNRP